MRAWVVAAVFVFVSRAASAQVLAVGNIEDHTQRFSAERLEQWRAYLGARIAASKKYRVAASSNARELLNKIKQASFAGGIDEASRVELGRELAAEKVLDVQIFGGGASCALVAALYDLERAVADEAYSRTTACDEDELHRSFDQLIGTITGEDVSEEEPWPVSIDLFNAGTGYGGTLGGATGPIVAGELFTIHYGPFRATLLDAGASMFASKGELFDQVDHTLVYAGSTIGAGLTFGPNDEHELRISAGPALYRASAQANLFTELKAGADETDGITAALIADARYVFHMNRLAFGGGLRAVLPKAVAAGDPTLVLMKLFLSFGSP